MSQPAREQGADGALAPYRAIHAHAELELELAGRGDVDGLVALGESWQELIAGLPSSPPVAAATLLERAQLIHERTRIELIRLRDALLSEFATATRARRTAQGYAGQEPRPPVLDRSA
ncbi:MAG TPA: hypothetical protein VFY36_02160 [Solirubrobacteraceae bacterium]|nr:hypothetical protein [Solirubrobacteraceae bacterium]